MTAFLTSLVAFPTALFTGALGLALCYWALVFLGALDIDFLDVDVDLDVDGDGLVDGAIDGAADGADALDGADGADGAEGGGGTASALARLLAVFRVRDVPITVSLSFMALFGWATCWLLVRFAAPVLAGALPGAAAGALLGLVAAALAVPVGRGATRPLAGLFHTEQGARRKDLIGQTVEITTGRVDDRFGQAEVATGGADLLVQVRARPGAAFTRGEHALVVSWDDDAEAYIIEPLRAAPPAAPPTAEAAPSPTAARAAPRPRDRDPDPA